MRWRAGLGLLAGGLILLSSAAHSSLGLKEMSRELAAAAVPAELTLALKLGWLFGGVAMLALGLIAVHVFRRRWRGEDAPAFPVAVIAAGYLAFGAGALVASRFDPFFLMSFVLPGLLMAVAAPRPGRAARS